MLETTEFDTALGQELYAALRERRTVMPLIERYEHLTIDDAYRVSLEFLRLRNQDGERVVGKKIGVTSDAVQEMLGVHQPDFGFLTDAMHYESDIPINKAGLIQPRAEAEIAFILKDDLNGPDVNADDVIAATEAIAPCFEVVDSRIRDWKISIVDTVADNASCGVFALGEARVDPRGIDLPSLQVAVNKNGHQISTGRGSAVQGSPAQAVAWLANTLGRYGVGLNAGDIILSGSLVPLEPAAPGDHFEMELGGIGSCSIRFH
ncbi:fumarylacetoacetate hydrolase family protein [Qipengyuania sp.]|uniref:fumarylacetoacetate hydrolase family protein n=1 Tax=Qipengyuania sp. TaxID=2004515 RepID=UPI003BAA2CAF